MKKIILSLLALATCGLATAQTLSVADVYVTPGGKASFALSANVGSGEYDSYQFTMTFPATGFSLTGNTTSISSWDGSLSTGTLAGGVATASGLSLSGTAIPSGDIVLGTVEFEAASTLLEGSYEVTISNFEFIDKGAGTSVPDVTFNVIVSDRLVLDETLAVLPTPQTGVNVTVKRTIKAGEWSTLCLPFGMSKSKANNAFGTSAKYAQFDGWTLDDLDEETLTPKAITLKFKSVTLSSIGTAIAAGTPYLIWVESDKGDISQFNVDNVNIVNTVTDIPKEGFLKDTEESLGNGKYTGTLARTTIPEYGIFLSGNKLYYSQGSTIINGFRGWIELPYAVGKAIVMDAPIYLDIDGSTTKIDAIQLIPNDGYYYDLNGMKIENPTKKGVYIHNGKKVVIK
jgi:hypothetical protein